MDKDQSNTEFKVQPHYYAILTAEVRYDNRLSALQKLIFAEITALTNKTGECWASNSYFAELYEVSETWVSLSIKKLCDLGYLNSFIDRAGGSTRYLTIKPELKPHLTRVKEGGLSRVKTNNTSFNNKNNILHDTTVSSEVNKLIELFKPINPSYKRLYPNTTQRSALERLIKEHGLEKIQRTIEMLPEVVTRPYAPKITTPLQLESKLGELFIFISQEGKKNGTRIAKI